MSRLCCVLALHLWLVEAGEPPTDAQLITTENKTWLPSRGALALRAWQTSVTSIRVGDGTHYDMLRRRGQSRAHIAPLCLTRDTKTEWFRKNILTDIGAFQEKVVSLKQFLIISCV